jgi:hypothetical protein
VWLNGHAFILVVYHVIFILPSVLSNSFAGKGFLGLKLFSFSAQNTSVHALLAFKIFVEKSVAILMHLPLYVT